MFQLILLLAVIVTGAFTSADDEVKKKERERETLSCLCKIMDLW